MNPPLCPHGTFAPNGHLLFLGRAENTSACGLSSQMPHSKALPLWGLAPTWPLPGSGTHRNCSSPQLEGFPSHLFPPCFSKSLKLFSNSTLSVGLRLLGNESQNPSASHLDIYLPEAKDMESATCSSGEQKGRTSNSFDTRQK